MSDRAQPPVAPRIPVVRDLHGQRDVDNYAWMRDHSAPAMQEYLAAERAYYDAETSHLAGLTKELYDEAVARTPQGTDDSVSWTLRGYHYRHRTPAGAEGKQLIRWRDGESPADGRVLLDEDVISADTGFVDVGTCEPSPDNRLLAWSADTSGAEIYELRFRDTATGQDRADVIERTYPGGAWAADSTHFFYLVPDALYRPYQMWRHEVGAAPGSDVLVYEESDARFSLTLAPSRSGQLVVLTSESRDSTEVWILPAGWPLAEPAVVAPRRAGVEYRVDHAADPSGGPGQLLIVTDDGAAEFRLMRAPADAPGRENWSEVPCPAVAPARDDTRLLRCDVLAGHLLLTLRRGGSQLLAITGPDGDYVREIWPAPAAGAIAVAHAEDYAAGSVVIAEESLIEPRVWSALDLATGQRQELKRAEVPGYAAARYLTRRLVATVSDGTGVPVTIAYREGTPLDGTAPCLLYGYGAYESSLDPEFEVSLPSVLDRGAVYAVAHVRGGGECGRNWWQQGRLRAKPTTFSDFIDVAGWLAGDSGGAALVDGRRIVSRGLSAGGLLQGAVYSRAPGRWRAVVAEVPFVDCVTTMLDPGIPLTIEEWAEWGDPRDPDDFACLRAYSPYDNPPAGARPALLVTGAVNDARVLVHEPAKWVARLREADDAGSSVLFRVELGAGAHTGPSGRYGHLRYEAEVYAFILTALGLAA
ncbi:MAG TPA: prolyl oligopeptidase family serine peptidase [Streptosporangiaceae bacterium]|nr:prolyl oligopeptidase family serine peptidase [Streptosporangiaceae bacterium]